VRRSWSVAYVLSTPSEEQNNLIYNCNLDFYTFFQHSHLYFILVAFLQTREYISDSLHVFSEALVSTVRSRALTTVEIKGAFLWGDLDQDKSSKITRIMVHKRNRWIHSGHGFIGSFDEPWSEWSWIRTDPDPDHLKGTHPNWLSWIGWCLVIFQCVDMGDIEPQGTDT